MNVLWALGAGLLVVAVQWLLFWRQGFRGVSYSRAFDRRTAQVGEEVGLVETLANGKRLTLPWLRVEAQMPAGLRFTRQHEMEIASEVFHKSIFSLGGFRRVVRRHRITCLKRGCYRLSTVTMTTGDLLGMAESTRQITDLDCELVVLPQLTDIGRLPIPIRSFLGDLTVRRFMLPDPVLVSGVREYLPGDSRRDVHWRATARSDRLMVKQRDYTADPRLMIYLNVQMTEDQWAGLNEQERVVIERAISCAASVAVWANRQGMAVGFATNGSVEGSAVQSFVPSPGPAHLMALLTYMGRMTAQRRMTFGSFLQAEMDSGVSERDILIISCHEGGRMVRQCNQLRAQGNTVLVVHPVGGEADARNVG